MSVMLFWRSSKIVAEMILVWSMVGGALRHLGDVALLALLLN